MADKGLARVVARCARVALATPNVQDSARNAAPITMRYDRNRDSLDRHTTCAIARDVAGSE